MKPVADHSRYVPFKTSTTLLLIALVVVLAIAPMFLLKNAEFSGADGLAEAAVAEISPDYIPWFKPLWEPASGEIESLFFSLQAALGAGVMGYFIGLWRGRKEKVDDEK